MGVVLVGVGGVFALVLLIIVGGRIGVLGDLLPSFWRLAGLEEGVWSEPKSRDLLWKETNNKQT